MVKFKNIGVLMGGLSEERDISLKSGEAVIQALSRRGYRAEKIIVDRSVDKALRKGSYDVIFNALHGKYGEDGCIQGLLEIIGIPYTGSGVLASSLAMHKVKAKEIFRLYNLPTPPYYVMERNSFVSLEDVHGAFGFPVIVKPAGEGSSLGVSLAHNIDELEAACMTAFKFDDALLVERYIIGKEIHVGILNGKALGAIEIEHRQKIFDYQAKYTPGLATYHFPARISKERLEGVLSVALRAHHVLGCAGATRVNMIVSELENEYILEVNTLPGLTPHSILPRIAQNAGLSYEDLILEILNDATLRVQGRIETKSCKNA